MMALDFGEIIVTVNGKPVKVDGYGVPVFAVPADWNSVSGKPAAFPPADHNHDQRYYKRSEVDTALAEKAAVGASYTKEQEDALLAAKVSAENAELTGIPTAPTAPVGANSTQIATTAFVQAELQELESHGAKRYGVSGIGLQTAALTRMYDAVGMRAEVGTNSIADHPVNDFDNAAMQDQMQSLYGGFHGL